MRPCRSPLSLAAGQSAEVLIGDPNLSCSVGVQISAGKVTGRGTAFPLAVVVNTDTDPEIVSAGRGLEVGFQDPQLKPGDRELVHARVRITGTATVAQLRQVPVTVTIVDTGRVVAVLPGIPQ